MRFGKCIICTSSFKVTDVASLPCGHTFHPNCINRWISASTTCPICRKPTVKRDVTKLFFNNGEDGATQTQPCLSEANETLAQDLYIEKERRLEAEKQAEELLMDVAEWQAKYEKVKKKADSLEFKEEKIIALESMLQSQGKLQRELDRCKNRLKACDFFALLRKKGASDESAIDSYITRNGEPDTNKFIDILKGQLKNASKQLDQQKVEICELRKEKNQLDKKIEHYKELSVKLEDESKTLKTKKKGRSPLKDRTNSDDYVAKRPKKSLGFSFLEDSFDQSALLQSAKRTLRERNKKDESIDDGFLDEYPGDVPLAKSMIKKTHSPLQVNSVNKSKAMMASLQKTPTFHGSTKVSKKFSMREYVSVGQAKLSKPPSFPF
ncbi:ring finger domain-containing protein [Ditylenchus destructor]|nr:ring finger domain-containing protein [Ditylenchus destructor]